MLTIQSVKTNVVFLYTLSKNILIVSKWIGLFVILF